MTSDTLLLYKTIVLTALSGDPGNEMHLLLHEFNENHCPWVEKTPEGERIISEVYVEGKTIKFKVAATPKCPAESIVYNFVVSGRNSQ